MPNDSTRPLVLAIDQGTSSTKGILLDGTGRIVATASCAIGQGHPKPGWVEQDATEIQTSAQNVISQLTGQHAGRIVTVGLSTQRESAVAWDRRSGQPLAPVIGWQDRRTTGRVRELTAAGVSASVRELSGLPLNPMFSALKFAALLDEVDPDRRRSRAGEIAVGTVDSWLLACFTGHHRTEMGNASRTQLMDLSTGGWSGPLLDLFGIPEQVLPEIIGSDTPTTTPVGGPLMGAPIAAVMADSHSALYAHGVRTPGSVKVTYGTGSSVMGLSDTNPVSPGLVRTIAWTIAGVKSRAFEGNIVATGATIKWLSQLFECDPDDISRWAKDATDTGGVDLVPAFDGLGSPWWDDDARAVVSGFHLGTTKKQLARAAMESIALQVEDVLFTSDQGNAGRTETLLTDGGASSNDWLMQCQADISQRTVLRSNASNLSAMGVALLAGSSTGIWAPDFAPANEHSVFKPHDSLHQARARKIQWLRALDRARARPTASTALQ